MKRQSLYIAALAVSIGMVSASPVVANPLFVEKPRHAFPELVMPSNIMNQKEEKLATDTDPRSRTALAKLVQQHQGMEWKDTRSGARLHLLYDIGETGLGKAQEQDIEAFARELGDMAEVIVIGFSDAAGGGEVNLLVSEERARRAAARLRSLRPDIAVVELHSVIWPGDPERARRTDLLEVRSAKRK